MVDLANDHQTQSASTRTSHNHVPNEQTHGPTPTVQIHQHLGAVVDFPPRGSGSSIAQPPLRSTAAFLPHSDEILEEAWESHPDKLYVPRQLSRLLGWDMHAICVDFDSRFGDWRPVGMTSVQIMEYLRDLGIPFHCIASGQEGRHHTFDCVNPQAPTIAWTVWNGYAYFYKSAKGFGEIPWS